MSVTTATPAAEQPAQPLLTQGRPGRPRGKERSGAYLYLAPVLISALIFTIVPFLYTLYIAFTNYNRLQRPGTFEWIGSRNFTKVFQGGSEFFPVLGWTAFFMVFTTLVNVGIGMILAMLLNHPQLKERNLYRTLLIIPWALPFILLVQVWAGIFQAQGPLNKILTDIGLDRVNWLPTVGDPTPTRMALLLVNLWFTYPFFMTVGLAALQSIPRDLYEVADLDGAGSWARFRDITFPFLLTAITPLLITQAAFQFNNAGIIILFTQGNPAGRPGAEWGRTDTLASYAYDLFFSQGDFGLAAAYSIVIFVVIAALTIVSSIVSRSFKEAV